MGSTKGPGKKKKGKTLSARTELTRGIVITSWEIRRNTNRKISFRLQCFLYIASMAKPKGRKKRLPLSGGMIIVIGNQISESFHSTTYLFAPSPLHRTSYY